jgi:CubicO group peptidase (beta-lactamase class C family)
MHLVAASLVLASTMASEVPRLMREGDVPGLSIVVIRDRRIASERAFGVASAGTRAPLARDAIFEAASLAKPVFAYAVLRLADAGVLDLDVPLAHYLDEPVSDPRMKTITARMVLTHTTGYQNEVMPGQALQVHFDPGARFSYSGAGFLHLQRVVESLTREPLPTLMQRLVFAPLGMRDSSYVWQPSYERRKVFGHTFAGVVNERRRPRTATVATLHTTARDYARFVIALMNGTGLEPATAAAMLATQVPVDATRHTCLSPCSGTMSTALSWGLGVGIEKSASGRAFWHWGENHGDTHTFMMGRGDGSGVVVFANSGNGHSIMPEVVAAALGGEHRAFAWMGYESYRAPARRVLRDVLARGVRAGELDALTEAQINRIGYALLARKRVDDAVTVFRRNAERFPQSANVHDSLGEAWMIAGNDANALASYRRSLELDPGNVNAAAMLEKLTRAAGPPPPRKDSPPPAAAARRPR